MSNLLPLLVVGVGRMGMFHLDVLRGASPVSVGGVVEPNSEVAAGVTTRTGIAAYTDIATACDQARPRAALIATPTPTHADLVETCLDLGLHVLCEKPLSLDPHEDLRLGEKASRAGLVLQVGFWRRYSPPWTTAQSVIRSGRIGEVVYMRLSQWDAHPPAPAFCDPDVSGGLAIDCGVHEYDLAEWLTGRRVTSVTARNLRIVDKAVAAVGDVDNLIALLDIEGGVSATVDLSRNARYADDVRTEVLGSDGAIFLESLSPARVRVATQRGFEVAYQSENEDAQTEGVLRQAEAFVSAVTNSIVDYPGYKESARAVAIGRAVQAAAASGEAVSIPEG